jgi:hypothetical protein
MFNGRWNAMNRTTTERRLSCCAAALALLLGGCAGYSPSGVHRGQSADEVAQAMGKPTARYQRADGGERIEYARGPMGKHTYMIDLDNAGRVTGWTQVLTEANFNALALGTGRDEVLRTLGTPSERQPIPRQHIDVWSYRYDTVFCQWFQVSVGDDGRVVETGYGPDPMCWDLMDSSM